MLICGAMGEHWCRRGGISKAIFGACGCIDNLLGSCSSFRSFFGGREIKYGRKTFYIGLPLTYTGCEKRCIYSRRCVLDVVRCCLLICWSCSGTAGIRNDRLLRSGGV